ncbi:MAG: ribose-5-phosphate isomerase RpiA [Pseudomonadota bacterium]
MDAYKKAAADAALELVEAGMTLGIGTGTTAVHFIQGLGAKGLPDVTGVATSEATRALAEAAGVRMIDPDEATRIDLAVDGADEIDGSLNLIKGGGGALLREKIVARAAARFVVIADSSKKVAQLGAFKLPLEIEPALFGLTITAVRGVLADAGHGNAPLQLRPREDGDGPQLSDGGGYLLDCDLRRIGDAASLDAALRGIPGLVETGLFLGMTDSAIIAGPDGVETINAA